MSEEERSGWRDKELSERHRIWGYNCPATNIDSFVYGGGATSEESDIYLEYDCDKGVALIEYKYRQAHTANPPNLKESTYKALIWLAEGREIPFLIVYYKKEPWQFTVVSLNHKLLKPPKHFTERQYVKTLYKWRKRTCPTKILDKLDAK